MYIFEIEDIVSFVHQLFIKFFKGKNVYNNLKCKASFVSKLSLKTGKGKKLNEYNQRELKAKNEAIIDEIEVGYFYTMLALRCKSWLTIIHRRVFIVRI